MSLIPATVHPLQGNTFRHRKNIHSSLKPYLLPNTFYTPPTPPTPTQTPSPPPPPLPLLPFSSSTGKTKVIVHALDKRDTLQGLALLYGVQVSDIRAANHLWPHESIKSTGKKHMYIPFELCTRFHFTDAGVVNNPQREEHQHQQRQTLTHMDSLEVPPTACRSYGAVLEAAFAFYNLMDARERYANPPVPEDTSHFSSCSTGGWSTSTISPRYAPRNSISSGDTEYEYTDDEDSPTRIASKRKTVELDTVDANRLSYFPSPPVLPKIVLDEECLPAKPVSAHIPPTTTKTKLPVGSQSPTHSARSKAHKSSNGGSILKVLLAAVGSNRNGVAPGGTRNVTKQTHPLKVTEIELQG